MRALPRSFVPLIFAVWACGGDAVAPPLAPALKGAPTASAPPAPAAISPPPAQPAAADVEPTPLTEEQKRRDAALGPDGTGLTNLTPGERLHRGEPQLPRDKPQMMIYAASRTTEATTTLFAQDLAGAPRVVYTQPKPGRAADVTPDGARVLVTETSSCGRPGSWMIS